MKKSTLLSDLQKATEEAIAKKENLKKEFEEKEKKRLQTQILKDATKRAEKKMKSLNANLLSSAKRGKSDYIVELLWKSSFVTGDGSLKEHWGTYEQKLFELLETGGYEPQVRKRKDGDVPYAYPSHDVPYVIVVSWAN